MKRDVFVGVFFILVCSSFMIFVSAQDITGLASSGSVGFNISVQGDPTLVINNPKNQTYVFTNSLLFKATSNAENLWYNIDHGANVSVSESGSSNVFTDIFNTTVGSHEIYVFANNSDGLAEEEVNFTVNLNLFNLTFSSFAGANSGASTNFQHYSFEQLQDLTGVVLEHTYYGMINFSEGVNVTDSQNETFADLDSYVEISSNHIEINSTALPGFDRAANLYLYNLTFDNPRVLKDGAVCDDCEENYYSSGTFSFNVSGFSVYSVEETPVDSSPITGQSSGGGGGGSRISTTGSFTLSEEQISVQVGQGSVVTKEFVVTNDGSGEISFEVSSEGLETFTIIDEKNFILSAGESKVILIDFVVRDGADLGVKVGKINVVGNNVAKEILVALNVQKDGALFDVFLEIPPQYKVVSSGAIVVADVEIFSLGNTGREDVLIEYTIMNENGAVVFSESETSALETRLLLHKFLNVPSNLEEGNYLLDVEITYSGGLVGASSWFEVKKTNINFQTILAIISLIIGIISLLTVIILMKHIWKEHRGKSPEKRKSYRSKR